MSKNIERMAERSGRSLKENNQYVNTTDYLESAVNDFGEIRTALRYPQLTLNAGLPLSNRRDYTLNSANGGGVEPVDGEYRVFATSAVGSVGSLITRQRANYLSGSVLEGGIGVRIPTQPTGNAKITFGFGEFDRTTQVQFVYDATGYRLQIRTNNVTEVDIPQSEWNVDKLDGTGASGATLDYSKGYVSQIPIVYYGYGDIRFDIMIVTNGRKRLITAHRESRDGQISINQANLPLQIEVFGDGTELSAFVGGRQINSSFPDTIRGRTTSGRRLSQSVGTTFVPLVSFKHKTDFNTIFCTMRSLTIETDADLIIEIHRGGTLTGATFAYLGNYVEAERALQYDIAATAITGGECVFDDFISATARGLATDLRALDVPDKYINEFDTFSLVARAKIGTATADTIFRNTEKW